jgi:hypothetical protein
MQRKGQDISPIHKLLRRLGPAIQQGKSAEAERLINEGLKLVGEKPREPEKKSLRR